MAPTGPVGADGRRTFFVYLSFVCLTPHGPRTASQAPRRRLEDPQVASHLRRVDHAHVRERPGPACDERHVGHAPGDRGDVLVRAELLDVKVAGLRLRVHEVDQEGVPFPCDHRAWKERIVSEVTSDHVHLDRLRRSGGSCGHPVRHAGRDERPGDPRDREDDREHAPWSGPLPTCRCLQGITSQGTRAPTYTALPQMP